MFTSVSEYLKRNFSYASRFHFAYTLPLFALLAGAAAVSATPALSRVSCGSKAFSKAGTDACSVYLSARTANRLSVALKSNNPALTVPGEVTVRAGAQTTGFNATVGSVTTTEVATITATAGGVSTSFSVTLSPAQGVAALSVNATSIGFGSVGLNAPVSQALTLTSTGTAAVTVSSVSLSGTGFSTSGASLPAVLNPGQAVTLEVQFDPANAGSYSGQLTVTSSASSAVVALSGTGAAPLVQLSWLSPAGTTDSIAGYNIYRSVSGSGTYQVLNATINTQTTFTDAAIQAGGAYNYYVTTVDAQGMGSVPSNVTNVAIP